MGDMADDLNEQLEADIWRDHFPDHMLRTDKKIDSPPFTWWSMNNGVRTRVSKMTDNHIMNCIDMIDRNPHFRQDWKEPLLKELESRK
jgi:hypothetical protein